MRHHPALRARRSAPLGSSTILAALLAAGSIIAGPGTPVAAATDVTPPVVGVPVAAPLVAGTVVSSGVPFRVGWTASDGIGTGIVTTALQVSVDGGSWARVTLASGTTHSARITLMPPHEARFRVRATDRAGNVSAWRYGATFRVRRIGETASGVTHGPGWTVVRSSGYVGGTALRARTAGAELSYRFTGSGIAWFGRSSPTGGSARVLLDGQLRLTVSTRSTTTADRRILYVAQWPSAGDHTITIRVVGSAGHPDVVVDGFVLVDPPAADPVLVGAGDIARCGVSGDEQTARLLDGIAGRVFAAGDEAYQLGTSAQFRDCYGPSWGRWKLRTSPVPGNHEYYTAGAAAYWSYFGSRAGTPGKGWYAYDLGTWRVYSLNANCTRVGCGAGSAQLAWLTADLAANPRACVAAVWHQPLFSSGIHGGDAAVRPFWNALAAAGADVVLNGHDHDYERFAPQLPDGSADPVGITEFVVGTGGGDLRAFGPVRPNSVARAAGHYGVLKLTLHPGSFDWAFVPVTAGAVTDHGTAACH